MSDWLSGIDVAEDFLAQAAASAPTVSELNRRFCCLVENSHFASISEQYKAKVSNPTGGQINQIVWEGKNYFNDKDLTHPPSFTIGAGFDLDAGPGDKAAENVVSPEGHTKFSGRSKYGEIIKNLSEKWGVTVDNEEHFKQIDPVKEEEFTVGPEARRFIRWYAKRNKDANGKGKMPVWTHGPTWNGAIIQMDKEEYIDKAGAKKEVTAPVGLAGLVGETAAEYKWYTDFLASIGTEVPWYALAPGQTVAERDEANGVEVKAPKPSTNGTTVKDKPKADEPKAETKTEETKVETKTESPKAAAGGGELADDDVIAQLTVLACENELADFKKKAQPIINKMPRWIPWIMKAPNYEALKTGEAKAPVKK